MMFPLEVYAVDCAAGKVKRLQPEAGGNILIFIENQNWHLLGNSKDPGVKEMFALALAAQAQDKPVIIRFLGAFDCSAYETSTPAYMLRLDA
ncbi:hypothetical protein [Saccharophagus degradans]|nr:hypothetical protein [Saccharophagus degradans]